MKDLLLRTGAQALHAVQDTLNDPQKREARLVRPTKAVAKGVGTAARFSLAFAGFVMSGMATGSSSRDDEDDELRDEYRHGPQGYGYYDKTGIKLHD